MNWQEVCADPHLKDLPYKIELNEWGQIVMVPTRLAHGAYQSRIGTLLFELVKQPGKVVTECAIKTQKGTKVADVAWFSLTRWEQVKTEYDSSIAPEICVEVLSPGNAIAEMILKRRLYLAAGAQEIWICDAEGHITFYNGSKKRSSSLLVTDFPNKISL